MGIAEYTLNQQDFTSGGTSFSNGSPITGWQKIWNGVLSESWVSYNDDSGVFTITEPGVYLILSTVQLYPSNSLNPGYLAEGTNSIYTYGLTLRFENVDGTPNLLAAPYTGSSRLASDTMTPLLNVSYVFYVSDEKGITFSVVNDTSVDIRVLNSEQSGSAGHISIIRLSNNILS